MTQQLPETQMNYIATQQIRPTLMNKFFSEIQCINSKPLREAVNQVADELRDMVGSDPDLVCSLSLSEDCKAALIVTRWPGLDGSTNNEAFVDIDRQLVFFAVGATATCSGRCNDPNQRKLIPSVLVTSKACRPIQNPILGLLHYQDQL